MSTFKKDKQYVKFCLYGFLKNLRFYDAFLLLFFLENGVSFSQIGILYASREILTNLFEFPSGVIADVYGRKNALLAAFFLYILSFLIFFFTNHFVSLLIGMMLIGVSDAFRSGTHKGMIMDYLKVNNWGQFKVEYYGNTRSWSQKGSAISALFAGIIVFFSGNYRIVYLLSIIPYILNFINIYTYPAFLNYSSKPRKRKLSSIKEIIQNVVTSLRQKEVIKIVNSSALHSSYLKAIKDYIQLIMVNIAILLPFLNSANSKSKNGLFIGIFYFFIYLMTSTASKTSGKFLKLIPKNIEVKTLLIGLSAGLISGIWYHYQYWWVTLAFFVIIYLIENLRKPILTAYLADQVSNDILTSVISFQSFYSTLVTAVTAVCLGLFADLFGISYSLILTSSVLIIITIVSNLGGSNKKVQTKSSTK